MTTTSGFEFYNEAVNCEYIDHVCEEEDYRGEIIRCLKIVYMNKEFNGSPKDNNVLIPVYTYSMKNSPLLDFLALDPYSESEFISYVNNYGYITSQSFLEYDIDAETRYGLPNEKLVDAEFICAQIAAIKSLVNLITAYKTKNYSEILTHTLFLMLNEFNIEYDNESHFYRFYNSFHDQLKSYYSIFRDIDAKPNRPEWIGMTLQEQLDQVVINDYDKFLERSPDAILFLDLISVINQYSTIQNIDYKKYVVFDEETSMIVESMTPTQIKLLTRCAESAITGTLNANISLIQPSTRIVNSNLESDWSVPNLLAALYMEMSIRESSLSLLKKCSNPTCPEYFDTTLNNIRKKYCCERCAQLMAKRNQRAREKKR